MGKMLRTMAESEKKQNTPEEVSKVPAFRFSCAVCTTFDAHESNPSANGTLELWYSMKKEVEAAMAEIATKYGIKSWNPEAYVTNYVEKYLKEYGFAPEIVTVNPKTIVFRFRSCPGPNPDGSDLNVCSLCENFEVLVAKIAVNGKVDFVKTRAKNSPYCEIEVRLG